jgi:hypothetical protein
MTQDPRQPLERIETKLDQLIQQVEAFLKSKEKKPTKRRVPKGPVGALPEFMVGHSPVVRDFLAAVPHELQRSWINAYPIDHILTEIRKADAWLKANAPKKDVGKFFTNWLARTKPSRPHPTQPGLTLQADEEGWV